MNENLSFDVEIPEFSQTFFDVDDEQIEEIKALYKTQCPVLWNSGMDKDQTFLRILAIGRKHKFEYLQHLVDDYFCGRHKNIESGFAENKWCKDHKHFKQISNFPKNKGSKFTPYEIAIGAVKAFGARAVPKLLFSNIIKIDDSVEINVKYMAAAIDWIGELIAGKQLVCPFQMDLCLGFGAPFTTEVAVGIGGNDQKEEEEDDDDDDDDDDDVEQKEDDEKGGAFFDCIGDIKGKLEKNKLKYEKGEHVADFGPPPTRMFDKIFKKFVNKLDGDKNKDYPHNKRFISFIDRRDGKKDADDVYIYEPPKNCRNIPKNHVPEWFIGASRTSLLPNMEYGDGKEAEAKQEKGQGQETKEKLINANIGSSAHCKGALLVLSLIAKEAGSIKGYLYWNGQITRFMPEDIKILFPKLFNMKWNNGQKVGKGQLSKNEEFMANKEGELDELIGKMKKQLTCKYYKGFVQSYM